MGTLLASPLYTVGAASGPQWQANALDDSGVSWICTDEAGWSSSPPARPSQTARTTGDGTITDTGFYDGRLVTLQGTCIAPDQTTMLLAKLAIKQVIKPRNPVTLRVDELHLSRQISVRLYDQVNITDQGSSAFKWQVGLFAGDPRLYSVNTVSVECELPGEGPGAVGRVYPRAYPRVYPGGGAGEAGQVTFDQQGDYDLTPAVITVAGPVINPVIQHAESGSQLAFNLAVNYGQELVVDLGSASATLQGDPASGFLLPGSAWFMLAEGANQVQFRGSPGAGPGGGPGSPRMTLTASSAWS